MSDYDLCASNAWYSNDYLNDTDQHERKELLQDVYEKLRDGADPEEVVMTAFMLGSAEGVATTADVCDLRDEYGDAEFPDY